MKNFVAYTLKRLGVDHIDIYRPGAARSGGADRGHDRRDRRPREGRLRPRDRPVGGRARTPSAARTPCIRSPTCRSSIRSSAVDPRRQIFPRLAELGIGVTAYGVLSRGLLQRLDAARRAISGAPAALHRRERARNEQLVAGLAASPAEKGITTSSSCDRGRHPGRRPPRRGLRSTKIMSASSSRRRPRRIGGSLTW